jgi:protein O-GlcNAc transferase
VTDDNRVLIQGIELQQRGLFKEALAPLGEFLKSNPDNAAAIYSIAVSLTRRGDFSGALGYLEHGVKVAPGYAPLWFIRAAALQSLGDKVASIASYDRAIELNPNYTEALINSGALLREMFRHREALERFNRVLQFAPDHQGALANTGIILTEFKQSEMAIKMFERLLAINPNYDYALGLLSYEKLHACDWTGFEHFKQKIIEGVREGRRATKTLAFMGLSDCAEDQLKCARTFANHYCPVAPESLWSGERYTHARLRVAYVSPDLREHPVGHLLAGVIEKHDKSRFELIGISIGVDDGSRIRARMKSAFDRFVDAKEMTGRQIAQLMRDLEVDIAIDLAGYTSDSKIEIFAWRPAPIQVGYLGYPGTLGVPYMDYILADRHVIPEGHQHFYDEKVAYLPHAYLPTDDSLTISERTPTRAECGLPDEGVVFCCFSHDYKITPPIFDVWMRLLQQVPGSVLWLAAKNDLSRGNLRKEAEKRGVNPERLVFAGRVPLVEDHFARYRQADIFLDTHPYNAHTTAADALMAGLPVVTFWGNAFPARVAGSLVHAAGLPELVADSIEGYEALALKLANYEPLLAATKAKLARIGRSSHLFDTHAFCRGLEAVYQDMYQAHLSSMQQGEEPVKESVGAVDLLQVGGKVKDDVLTVAIPVYRSKLTGFEEYSFLHSMPFLNGRHVELLAPESLDVGWYVERCPYAKVKRFDGRYFASIKGYNELLLDPVFYAGFKPSEYLLILQTDAMLLSDDIDPWLKRGFDYVGAPWPQGVEVFVNAGRFEGKFGKRVRAHVGNGGFSLRRIDKCIGLLSEFEILRDVFIRSGSSEDLFFSLLGGLSADFVIPNEVTASYFSMELEPQYYFYVNGNHLPLGTHAWWKSSLDFWRAHVSVPNIQ